MNAVSAVTPVIPVAGDGKAEKSVIPEKEEPQHFYIGSFTEEGIYHTFSFTDNDIKNGTVDKARAIPHIVIESHVKLTQVDNTSITLKIHENDEQFRDEDILFLNTHAEEILSLEVSTSIDELWNLTSFKHFVSFFPNLETLNLEGCRFDPCVLSELQPLTKLQRINLSHSTLEDQDLEMLLNCHTSLKSLNLSYCKKVTDEGLKRLASHKNLKTLVLRDIAVSPETLMLFSHVTKFHLSDIKSFSNEHLRAIGTLTCLECLKISSGFSRYNSHYTVSDDGIRHLVNLSKLTSLDISRNSFKDAALVHVAQLAHLTSLNISFSDYEDEGIKHLAPLVKLTTFNAKNCRYSEHVLEVVKQFSNLRTLSLSLKFTKEAALALANLTHLRVLRLEGVNYFDSVNIDTSNFLALKPLTELTELDLSYCTIDDEGLKIIATQFLKLETVIFTCCTKITSDGLKSLLSLSQLKKIELTDCTC